MLDSVDAAERTARVEPAIPRRGPARVLAAAGAGAALLLVAANTFTPSGVSKLTFKRGELYFNRPVTQDEAQRVGHYLLH